MNISDLFWTASPEELKKGYVEEGEHYICLLCGKKIEKGIIYPGDGILYEAVRYMSVHIDQAHKSVFECLVQLDKRLTGLTDHQKSMLQLFYQGKSDGEVQREMGIGSASTIRNHRFVLKEKERQAKIFLVLMELLKDKNKRSPGFVPPHKTARMIDDRYNITQEESGKILKKYFPEGTDGHLTTLDMKEKNKLIVSFPYTAASTLFCGPYLLPPSHLNPLSANTGCHQLFCLKIHTQSNIFAGWQSPHRLILVWR